MGRFEKDGHWTKFEFQNWHTTKFGTIIGNGADIDGIFVFKGHWNITDLSFDFTKHYSGNIDYRYYGKLGIPGFCNGNWESVVDKNVCGKFELYRDHFEEWQEIRNKQRESIKKV